MTNRNYGRRGFGASYQQEDRSSYRRNPQHGYGQREDDYSEEFEGTNDAFYDDDNDSNYGNFSSRGSERSGRYQGAGYDDVYDEDMDEPFRNEERRSYVDHRGRYMRDGNSGDRNRSMEHQSSYDNDSHRGDYRSNERNSRFNSGNRYSSDDFGENSYRTGSSRSQREHGYEDRDRGYSSYGGRRNQGSSNQGWSGQGYSEEARRNQGYSNQGYSGQHGYSSNEGRRHQGYSGEESRRRQGQSGFGSRNRNRYW
jgi:hypothetical protein